MEKPWLRVIVPFLLAVLLLGLLSGALTGFGPWQFRQRAQASATVRYVAAGGPGSPGCTDSGAPCASIQEALDAAALNDEIRVAEGVYSDLNSHGGSDQVIYVDKSVTLRGGYPNGNWTTPAPQTNPAIIDPGELGRGVLITGSITPTLEGFFITNGTASGWGGASVGGIDAGGAIYVYGASATISNNTIITNVASGSGPGYGGGIYLWNSDATIVSNTLQNNSASLADVGSGGGIFLRNSPATLAYNQILSNRGAGGDFNGSGGGINALESHAHIHHNTIAANSATLANPGSGREGLGGGIRIDLYSQALVEHNVISGNVAGNAEWGRGGGLYLAYSNDTVVRQNVLRDNLAAPNDWGFGGGIYVNNSNSRFENNALLNNYSGIHDESRGAAIAVYDAAPTFLHTTISTNSGGNDSGVYATDTAIPSAVLMHNTIIANQNIGVEATLNSSIELYTTLWHAIGGEQAGDGTISRNDDRYGDPRFAADGYHLEGASEAIDQGVDAGVAVDIDGQARPQNGNYDIGADEYLLDAADLELLKTGSPLALDTGERLTYTLQVANIGTQNAENVRLTDTLPADVTFYSATPSQGTCGAAGGGTLTCTLNSLNAGAQATVTLIVTPTQGGYLNNQAIVGSSATEPNTSNNSAAAQTLVDATDLQISKQASPNPVLRDETLTYTLNLTNSGAYPANNILLTDTLPANVTFYNATPSQGNCAEALGIVTCTLGSLSSGATANVSILVTPTVAGELHNLAQVSSSTPDINNDNNSAEVWSAVASPHGVELSSDTPSLSAAPGDSITYTLRITNSGSTSDSYDLLTSDNLWAAGAPATLGPLAPGTASTFEVTTHVTLTAAHGDQDSLRVRATSQNDPGEWQEQVLTTLADAYAACSTVLLNESFESGTLPAGWSNSDDFGGGVTWRFDNPAGRENLTGGSGGFAIVDSDQAGAVVIDTQLNTPQLDFSGINDGRLLFNTDFYSYSGGLAEVAAVDVSTDGGGGWSNVWQKTADYRGPHSEVVDIAAITAEQPDVRVRFRYHNANYEWWWQVDNVKVISCIEPAVVIAPKNAAKSGLPGTSVTYTLHVTNSNASSDSYTLASSDNLWNTQLPSTLGPLDSGASSSFVVSVSVPSSAAANDWDEATIIVRSQSTPTETANAILRTSAAAVPELQISKTPDVQTLSRGGTASFTIFVTNSTTGDLNNVVVNDVLAPDCALNIGFMDVGESRSHTCSRANVTSSFTNTATAQGTPPAGPDVLASDSARVNVVDAQIDVTLLPTEQTILTEDNADFTVVVSNIGTLNIYSATASFYQGLTGIPACSPQLEGIAVAAVKKYTCTLPNVSETFTAMVQINGQSSLGPVGANAYAHVTTVEPAALSSQVWHDANADGQQDVGETVLPTVTLRLYHPERGFIAAAQSDISGTAHFSRLMPGSYFVQVDAPYGSSFSPAHQASSANDSDVVSPTTGHTDQFTLSAGVTETTIDAGIYRPLSLGDRVWEDRNGDGVQDPDETGLVSVTLNLYSAGVGYLSTTQSDHNGRYSFDNLKPGSYTVTVLPPANYRLSPQHAVISDSIDSDFDAAGQSEVITLTDRAPDSIDAGLLRPSVQFAQSEITVQEGVGSATVSVTLNFTASQPISVGVAAITGTGSADAADFSPLSSTLIFAPGQQQRNFSVNITSDGDYEEDETLLVALHNPQLAQLGTPANLTLRIANDDAWPMQRAVSPCALDSEQSSIHNRVDIVDVQLAAASLNLPPALPEHDINQDGVVSSGEIYAVARVWRGFCDNRTLAWAQDSNTGSRRIYLRWRVDQQNTDANTVYDIYRRTVGSATYSKIASTQFAQNTTEMTNKMPADLRTQLRLVDLKDANLADDSALYNLLKSEFTTRTAILAENYAQVAQAIGLGYLDSSPPSGPVEYYVIPQGRTWPLYGPTVIAPTAGLPAPQNLREGTIFNGPAQLGVQNSTRPFTATERFEWDAYQNTRRAHGAAYLLWDLPSDQDLRTQGLSTNFNVSGYKIYRRGPATQNTWQISNPALEYLSGKQRLVRPGDPRSLEDPGAETFIEDEVVRHYNALSPTLAATQVYTNFDYRVCPVDMLGNQGPCGQINALPIRDLDSPAMVQDLHTVVAPDHGEISVTWAYSDVTEVSLPLHFFVSRSPSSTVTAAITTWVPLNPQGMQLGLATPRVTMTVKDTPPVGETFWYRVQVRDNAGNWSAPSAPVKGTRYTRTQPSLSIPYHADCRDSLPLTLTTAQGHFGPEARQIVLYRSFKPISATTNIDRRDKTFQLIRRFRIENGSSVIDDSYMPPYPVTVWYRIEALDGHGNLSLPQVICVKRNPGTVPDFPAADVGDPVYDPDNDAYTFPLLLSGTTGGLTERLVRTTRPVRMAPYGGPLTPSSSIKNVGVTPAVSLTLEEGETAQVEIFNRNINGNSAPRVKWVRKVNNFLNTNRQLTDLGDLHGVWWGPGSPPTVTVLFPGQNPDATQHAEPLVALYRRIPGGNWLQVTPLLDLYEQPRIRISGPPDIYTWGVVDDSDLSPEQSYDYKAVAFSPNSYEILGEWNTITLAPQSSGPAAITVTTVMTAAPTFTSTCGYDDRAPGYYGWPENIELANGWFIQVTNYRDYAGCDGLSPDPTQLYGYGQLRNGAGISESINFVDIGVNGDWRLDRGRVATTLDHSVAQSDRLNAHFGRIEFTPGESRAGVTLTLPSNVKVIDLSSGARSRNVFGRVSGVDVDFSFSALAIDTLSRPLALVDENLPWRLESEIFNFGDSEVTLNTLVQVHDRLTYMPPPIPGLGDTFLAQADNNMALLRALESGSAVRITKSGLQGTFTQDSAFEYSTSMPAAVIVSAANASVQISDSRVSAGTLNNANVRLDYIEEGSDISYMSGRTQELYAGFRSVDPQNYNPFDHIRRLESGNGNFPIGVDGVISAPLVLSPTAMTWAGSFSVALNMPEVYASFYAGGTTPQVDPVQNGWQHLPGPLSNDDLDPGININAEHNRASYDCFDPGILGDVELNLYVRRGGVSEHFRPHPSSYGVLKDRNGYEISLREFNLLFVDNGIIDPSTLLMDLYLPYPSDVEIPLKVTEFTASGCPSGGKTENSSWIKHLYWNFEHAPITFDFVPISQTLGVRADYMNQYRLNYPGATQADALNALPPRILSLFSTARIVGLNADDPGAPSTIALRGEWFPNGDYGDMYPMPESEVRDELPDYFHMSGLPYALHDVKLSRFYSRPLDKTSLPDTMGLELEDVAQKWPDKVLDDAGQLTPQSLAHCALLDRTGCGFVIIDGNSTTDYFGEVQTAPGGHESQFKGDDVAGESPIASNNSGGSVSQAPVNKGNLNWLYPVIDDYLDFPAPIKFLANSYGGALAGVIENATLLPGVEVIKTDIALVVTMNFSETFYMDFGIFAGYNASQAAFRALAMNRPADSGGVEPYEKWDQVSDDIGTWMKKFGYESGSGESDDPYDLAKKLWSDWGSKSYTETYKVVVPVVRKLEGNDVYGITGIQSGKILKDAGTTLSNGLGQVVFSISGGDFRLDNVYFGVVVDIKSGTGDDAKKLFAADWIALEINRDGEIYIEGEKVKVALSDDFKIEANVYLLIGSAPGNQRIEGGITLAKLEIASVSLRNVGAVFGAGQYNYQPLFYLGLRGEGDFDGYRVGAAILFGMINPDSKVLRAAGFAQLLDKIGGDGVKSGMQSPQKGTFGGIYLAVWGDVPIYNYSCVVNVTAAAEVRFWYFTPMSGGLPIYGGYMRGSVYGTGLCLIHARGELSVSIEKLRPSGKSQGGRTCPKSATQGCTAFSGEFWIAAGIGSCEPKTWSGWKNRWWNDDWCYTAGIQAEVTYIDHPNAGEQDWDAALHPDAE